MPSPAGQSVIACLFGIVVAMFTPIVAPADAQAPTRIVSLNLCTDQWLLLLAPRDHIAALSSLAVDPDLSALWQQVGTLPLTHGTAEEVLPLAPDLVLAGRYTARPTVALLKARGVKVLEIDLADDFEAVRAQARQVAAALDRVAAGEALIAAMDAQLAAAAPPADAVPGPRILNMTTGAFTAGSGTLHDAVIRAAGLRNYAAEKGLAGYGYLALETLAADPPDLLIANSGAPSPPSLAGQLLSHPVLAAAVPQGRRVDLPARFWTCGGPFTADAVTRLAALRPATAPLPQAGP